MKKNPSHEKNLIALKRIEGQIRGIQRMVESRKYCVDIMVQLQAVRGALARVEDKILEKHFASCVTNAAFGKSAKDKRQKLNEILDLIHRSRKT